MFGSETTVFRRLACPGIAAASSPGSLGPVARAARPSSSLASWPAPRRSSLFAGWRSPTDPHVGRRQIQTTRWNRPSGVMAARAVPLFPLACFGGPFRMRKNSAALLGCDETPDAIRSWPGGNPVGQRRLCPCGVWGGGKDPTGRPFLGCRVLWDVRICSEPPRSVPSEGNLPLWTGESVCGMPDSGGDADAQRQQHRQELVAAQMPTAVQEIPQLRPVDPRPPGGLAGGHRIVGHPQADQLDQVQLYSPASHISRSSGVGSRRLRVGPSNAAVIAPLPPNLFLSTSSRTHRWRAWLNSALVHRPPPSLS